MIKRLSLTVLVGFLSIAGLKAQWIWDAQKMQDIKEHVNQPAYAPAYATLIAQADRALHGPIYSVTTKKGQAPSGDKHDYVSLSRYWWPNPDTKDGMPYIFKDGQSNPELAAYDRNTLGDMCGAVNTLALAYFYSGQEKYADKAVQLVRTWFFDEDTRMNPNLEYSQFIPGRDGSKGRPEGLIDSYSFVGMINSLPLLKKSASYNLELEHGLQQWFADFAKWMKESSQGIAEEHAKNNHATAYDAQMVTYYLFSGNEEAAKKLINDFPTRRIFAQIEPDGKQPNELWRTLAYHYSQYNLSHMLDVVATAQKLGINLLEQKSADGRSIYKAMDYLATFLGKGVASWPYKQISGWEAKQQDVCVDLMRIVELDPTKTDYINLAKTYSKLDLNDRRRLLYPTMSNLTGTQIKKGTKK